MRAALDVAEDLPDAIAKPARKIEAEALAMGRLYVLAAVGTRHSVHRCLRGEHREVAVDRQANPHFVDRLPGAAHAGLQLIVVVLGIEQMRFDVPEAVRALVAFVANTPRMGELALDLRNREGRRRGF